MDQSTKPCSDFYKYANGKWLATAKIPADRPFYGVISKIEDRNHELLRAILDEAANDKSAPSGSVKRKVGDFYHSGMDAVTLENEGAKPLSAAFATIATIHDQSTLQAEIAWLHRHGIDAAFNLLIGPDAMRSDHEVVQLSQGGLGLPNRDFYFGGDLRNQEIRREYVAHITRTFELLAYKPETAATESKAVVDLETELATASIGREAQHDPSAVYHKYDLADLNLLTRNFAWKSYLKRLGLHAPGKFNVGQPDFFKEFDRLLVSTSLPDWKAYLRWKLISATASKLSRAFVDEDFRFNGTVLTGAKAAEPRWKRVLKATDELLGEALGQLFVARVFDSEAKKHALAMVENIKASFGERLSHIDWISDETRRQALEKLAAMKIKIGYPDKWRDYSALRVNHESYVLNFLQAKQFEFDRNLQKAGRAVDRSGWKYTPQTVDAYYDPNLNEIVFPAGILQPPYFDAGADDPSNYGAIGIVIGHEMTHGFDDQGRKFDAVGNLRNWWTTQDESNFQGRAKLIERQFDDLVVVDDVHTNGHLTLNENIADLGGVKIAFLALQKTLAEGSKHKITGDFTPEQRFFLAYGQIWRAIARPEIVRLFAVTDTHALPPFRVNAPLANLPEFSAAFGCKAGDAEFRPDDLRVSIW